MASAARGIAPVDQREVPRDHSLLGGFLLLEEQSAFFCDWEGNQRELEELSGHTGLSYISGSLPEVEGSDGSIWFLLPQGEAVPFSIGQMETSAEVGRAETSVE